VTPDDDPRWLYHDTLVTIDLPRGLNNGLPSLWARSFDHLDWNRGRRVMQIGAGTGYYTAVLAEIVGPTGRVIAVECDAGLAGRARDNVRPWAQVEVVEGDGRTHDPGDVDTVVVFAGSTHPAPLWLDRLTAGGQLLMPLTAEDWLGFLLRVTRNRHYNANLIVLPSGRDPNRFEAASIGPVGIFPCNGGRDLQAAQRLRHMLDEHRHAPRCSEIPIGALHRGEASQGVMDKVWYQGRGFWLERTSD
jgi:protein-L-isoaspartate(D-aspartate) O-methyltransferase